MPIRVKLEAPNKKGRYAYASDEHAASSYGRPVIVLGNDAYGPAELDYTVVTSDRALAGSLQEIGYRVRVSDPQAKWQRENVKPMTIKLTTTEREALAKWCAAHNTTPHALLKAYIESVLKDG